MSTNSEGLRILAGIETSHLYSQRKKLIDAADALDELVGALEDYKYDILAGIHTISTMRLSSNETGYAATMELKIHDEMLRSKLRQLDFLIAKHKGGAGK